MAPTTEVMGGFRRILVRLDAPTRREYCVSALENELSAVCKQLRACAAALAQAKQVEDATKQLEASVPGGSARVASPTVQALLAQLEGLQQRGLQPFLTLCAAAEAPTSTPSKPKRQRKASVAEDDRDDKDAGGKRKRSDARAVVHELDALLAEQPATGEAASKSVELVRRFLELLPEQQDKHAGFWSERLKQRVVLPVVQQVWLAKDVPPATLEQNREYVAWLVDQLQSAGRARPHLAPLCRGLEKEAKALLAKRERKDARRKGKEKDEGEGATPSTSKGKKRRLPEEEGAMTTTSTTMVSAPTASAARMSIHEVRATLSRCAREVKQASDRAFELAAFDANLKRLVDVVGAISHEFSYDDCTSLTVALFAMVEQVERLADAARRRDRLVCLEGLLQLLIESSDVPLSSRRRTMAKEYLQNCQQSIQLLDRAGGDAAVSVDPVPSTPPTAAETAEDDDDVPIVKLKKPRKKKGASASGGSNHVRFG